MAQISPLVSDVTPNSEVDAQYKNTSVGAGVENLGNSLQAVQGQIIESNVRLGMAKADTAVSANIADLETKTANQKESFDPQDPDAQSDFFQQFDDANSKILSGISNNKVLEYTQKKMDDVRGKYWNLALHNNAIVQGKEYGDMLDQRINNDAQAVSLNPAMLQDRIDSLQDLYAYHPGQNDKATVEKSIEDISKKLTVAAVKGRIYDPNQDPSAVVADLKSGKYNPGDATDSLIESAQKEVTSRQKQAQANQKAAVVSQKQDQVKTYQDLINTVDSGQSSFSQINKMADDGLIDQSHAAQASKRQQDLIDGNQKSDPKVKYDLFKEMSLPDGDPNKPVDFADVTSKYGHGLSQKDLQQASSIFLAPVGSDGTTKAGMISLSQQASKALIRPTEVPWGDRQGVANWSNAINDMHNQYQQNIKTGAATPQEMFDPSSPKYLGSAIQKYQRSRSDMTQAANTQLYAPPAVAPGVTTQAPIGTNPNGPPVNVAPKEVQSASPAYSDKQKAVIDSVSAKIMESFKANK